MVLLMIMISEPIIQGCYKGKNEYISLQSLSVQTGMFKVIGALGGMCNFNCACRRALMHVEEDKTPFSLF